MTSSSPTHPAPLERFQAVLSGISEVKEGTIDDLVDALTHLDTAGEATGDAADATAALRMLGERPGVVLRLDGQVRWATTPAPVYDRPVALAFACSDSDGRVRERAVRRILDRPSPELMPFLVLRTGDWVRQVRERARAGLTDLLSRDPARFVPAAAPTALLADRRRRGDFARRQVLAALLSAPGAALLDGLLASPLREQRRFALEVAGATGGLPLRTLVSLAEGDTDVRIRARAAEAAAREAVWTDRADLLRRLAAARHREVRATALTGLIRTGHPDEATAALDDPAGLVRAVARDAARRTGTDVLAHYRAAVSAAASAPQPPTGAVPTGTVPTGAVPTGAVDGLAETGSAADAPLLLPLLDHPQAPVRAHALHALRAFGAAPADRVIPLLRDPSGKVIRQAVTALRPHTAELPPGLAAALLTDSRAVVRRAGHRLLSEPDPVARLRTLLSLAADPDPRLSARVASDITALAHGLHPRPGRPGHGRGVAPLDTTAEQRADLLTLTDAATAALPHRTRQLLYEGLDPTSWTAELLRARHGSHPDTVNPLLELRATYTSQDPWATAELIRDVLRTVLEHAAAPAGEWPAEDKWPTLLPEWFVQRCAPEPPPPPERTDPATWLARWRGLTQRQRQAEAISAATADWRLTAWLDLFDPDGLADSRSWRFWDSGTTTATTGWVRVGVDGHPYGGRGALLWLIEAAGGYDIDLP
ncbi:HEAT repeat domain-containing protein [Streptomyces milbemycinicus]|uniref:HEAT repeat domain-containing protein n=1 Tax=Streptomyces milbemycinicus TaxID=476552 RepID=UPI0033C185CC